VSGAEDVYRGAGSESDSSDHLIVDESKVQRPQLKPGSLKMRLPGKAVKHLDGIVLSLSWNWQCEHRTLSDIS